MKVKTERRWSASESRRANPSGAARRVITSVLYRPVPAVIFAFLALLKRVFGALVKLEVLRHDIFDGFFHSGCWRSLRTFLVSAAAQRNKDEPEDGKPD